jgi:PII-like signaling protein
MQLTGDATLLRIFIGEADKHRHTPLYEAIVKEARTAGLAGATAWRGVLSFGANSRIRSAKILDLSSDLPLIIEIVDEEPRISAFLPRLNTLFEEAQCGGLVTMEKVGIIRHLHSPDATHPPA